MIKIGIVGGTGYTGVELLRLLAVHPQASVRAITSRKEAGMPVAEMFPSLRRMGAISELRYTDPANADLRACDVVFFATPHGVAMSQARELVGAGIKIIDLAADFRLKDPAEFEQLVQDAPLVHGPACRIGVWTAGDASCGDRQSPDRG